LYLIVEYKQVFLEVMQKWWRYELHCSCIVFGPAKGLRSVFYAMMNGGLVKIFSNFGRDFSCSQS